MIDLTINFVVTEISTLGKTSKIQKILEDSDFDFEILENTPANGKITRRFVLSLEPEQIMIEEVIPLIGQLIVNSMLVIKS